MKNKTLISICILLIILPSISTFGTLIDPFDNTTNYSYVPYNGATGNVDLGSHNISVDFLHADDGIKVSNNIEILGNYLLRWRDSGDTVTEGYIYELNGEMEFYARDDDFLFRGNVTMDNLTADWGFFDSVNSSEDNWCNQTSCYNFSDFLTGGGLLYDQWLNTTSNVTFANITLTGNLTSNSGAIFRGATLGDYSTGYENIRFGVWSHTPRIILDNGTLIGQIDFVGNTMRFIINDTTSGHTRARLRINSTTVRVGENLDRVDLEVWGEIRTRGGENLFIDGNVNISGDLNVTGNYIHNTNTGLTGNYSVGTCWMAYSGGIMYNSNCTTF